MFRGVRVRWNNIGIYLNYYLLSVPSVRLHVIFPILYTLSIQRKNINISILYVDTYIIIYLQPLNDLAKTEGLNMSDTGSLSGSKTTST